MSGLAQGGRCWQSVRAEETGNVKKQSPLEGQEVQGSRRRQTDTAGGVSWGHGAQGGMGDFEGLELGRTVDVIITKWFLWAKRTGRFQGCPSQEADGVLRRVEVAGWWRPAGSGDWR